MEKNTVINEKLCHIDNRVSEMARNSFNDTGIIA